MTSTVCHPVLHAHETFQLWLDVSFSLVPRTCVLLVRPWRRNKSAPGSRAIRPPDRASTPGEPPARPPSTADLRVHHPHRSHPGGSCCRPRCPPAGLHRLGVHSTCHRAMGADLREREAMFTASAGMNGARCAPRERNSSAEGRYDPAAATPTPRVSPALRGALFPGLFRRLRAAEKLSGARYIGLHHECRHQAARQGRVAEPDHAGCARAPETKSRGRHERSGHRLGGRGVRDSPGMSLLHWLRGHQGTRSESSGFAMSQHDARQGGQQQAQWLIYPVAIRRAPGGSRRWSPGSRPHRASARQAHARRSPKARFRIVRSTFPDAAARQLPATGRRPVFP